MSPTTWPEPDEILTVEDPQLGCVKLLVWRGWHFKKTGAHAFIVLWLEHPHTHGMHRAPKDLWVA